MSFDWKMLMHLAYQHALTSRDPSTQVGALLVNDEGSIVLWNVNAFPRGVHETDERWERPLKYKVIEHAERNVIYNAASEGFPTKGLTMVCPWAACSDCARAIIEAGIARLVTHKQAHDRSPAHWAEEVTLAFIMLHEAGVEVIMYDNDDVGGPEIRQNGKLWKP